MIDSGGTHSLRECFLQSMLQKSKYSIRGSCVKGISFFSQKRRIGDRPYLVEVSKIEATDINEYEDFLIADALYQLLRNEERNS